VAGAERSSALKREELETDLPHSTFLFTLKFPMRFSASTAGTEAGTSTYSTFGILRFTVLSRVGRTAG
jgi:hypothetical protein